MKRKPLTKDEILNISVCFPGFSTHGLFAATSNLSCRPGGE